MIYVLLLVIIALLMLLPRNWEGLVPYVKRMSGRQSANTADVKTVEALIDKALQEMSCNPVWEDDAECRVVKYDYQNGHFNMRIEPKKSFVGMSYLFFFNTSMENLSLVRSLCNQVNMNSEIERVVYSLNEEKNEIDLHIITGIKPTKEGTVEMLKRVMARPQVDDSFIWGKCYPTEIQRKFSDYLMDVITINKDRCSIGETEHPFTTFFNKKDVRITTHYHEETPIYSMYSVIHEGGHALYELHSADELEGTLLSGGVSMSIHESQSRFMENYIGRSREFIGLIFPKMQELFPEQLAGVTPEQMYLAVNKAEPSLIRTEADELTYALHVLVRYEIEKSLFDGSISVEELPAVWNAKYKEYLGIEVPDDKRGVLQDSHWSGGNVGYFPSYALGSAYGAQMLAKMRQSVDVEGAIRSGDLRPITGWLEEHIWKFGCLYDPMELLERALGEPFNPRYFTDYLEEKFTAIYGL